MNESLTTKAFSAVRWTSLNTICQIVIQILTLVILGRLLSPEAFGLMAMVMVVVEIVNVFARMGLGEAIIYKKEISQNEISSLFYLNVFVGFFLFCTVFFSSSLVSYIYSEPDLIPLVRIVALIFFISSFGVIFEVLLRKHLLFNIFSQINILSHVVSFVAMVTMAIYGFGVYSLVLGQVVLQLVKSFMLFGVALIRNWTPRFHFKLNETTFFVRFGVYRVLAMSANQFNSRSDQLMIGALLGPVALGFYNVAFRVIYLPIQKISPILTQVAFPFFAKIQDDTPRLKRVFLKYANLVVSINAPVLFGIAALAPIIVPLVLGQKWTPSVPIVQSLTFYIFVRSLFNASGGLLIAKGKANWECYWNLVMLFIIPSIVYLSLAVYNSVIYVSLSLGFMFFVFFFFWYALFLRKLLGPFLKEYLHSIARPFLLAASMGVFTYLLSLPLQTWPKPFSAPILIVFGVCYYSVMTLYFNPQFVNELEKLLPGKMGRFFGKVRSKLVFSHFG